MSKFNVRDLHAATGQGPIAVKTGKPKTTHEGGTGYVRDARSELFLTACTSLDITADTFYVAGDARVERYTKLVRQVAVTDPVWMAEFLAWLRGPGNIRTAAIVGAVEAVRAMVAADIPGGRHITASVLQRPDEPGELVAYHLARYGRNLPMPIKRGLADAVRRLYTERALLKYDTVTHAVRFGDVIELVHPAPSAPWQDDLFRHAIDRRHARTGAPTVALVTLTRNAALRARFLTDPLVLTDADAVRDAGMTWEDVLSLVGDKVDKARLWAALIPSMGYMALLRNLRNFDQAGVPDSVTAPVAGQLADPAAVAASRQLPMRFLSAHRHAPSLRWAYPLEQALDHAVRNIPALGGRTLVLIDTSGSMNETFGKDGTLKRWDAAVVFGLALARRCDHADVVSYSGSGWSYGRTVHPDKVFPYHHGESLLRAIGRWQTGGYFIGGGTDTIGAVRRNFGLHDRVVILTDEQHGNFGHGETLGAAVPATTPLYVFNLAGYQAGSIIDSPNRVTLGGLTDAMFSLIARVESGRDGAWPWESPADTP